MDKTIGIPLAALLICGGALITAVFTLIKVSIFIGEYKLKVNVLWEASLRRGQIEGIKKGLFEVNSPIVIAPEVREVFRGLLPELRAFYQTLPLTTKADDNMVAALIEDKFGERMVKEICIPLDIYNMACLVAAVELAREA